MIIDGAATVSVLGGKVLAANVDNTFTSGAWADLAAPDAVVATQRRAYRLVGSSPATLAVVWS